MPIACHINIIGRNKDCELNDNVHHGIYPWLQQGEDQEASQTLSPGQLIESHSGYITSSDELALQSKLWADFQVQGPALFENDEDLGEPSPLVQMDDGSIYLSRPLADSTTFVRFYKTQQI